MGIPVFFRQNRGLYTVFGRVKDGGRCRQKECFMKSKELLVAIVGKAALAATLGLIIAHESMRHD
jgi:hypothetical protein